MDAITHLLVGRLLAAPLEGPLAILATLFAVLPDVDTIVWAFPRLRRHLRHRGATHSLAFGVVASVLAGVLFAAMGWSSFLAAFALALLGFLTHVLLDVLNWGCALLWPFRGTRVEYTVHHSFRRSIPLAAAGVVLLEATRLLLPAAHLPLAALLGGGILGYFGLRVGKRLAAERDAPAPLADDASA